MLQDFIKQKYFLCFGFENFSPTDLKKFHVTLLWLGEEDGWTKEQIIEEVNKYFDSHFTCQPEIAFHKRDYFGFNKTIPVLLPTDPLNDLYEWLHGSLRTSLEKFASGEVYPFNPHLTTSENGLSYFKGTINKLYLCGKGYQIFKEWDL